MQKLSLFVIKISQTADRPISRSHDNHLLIAADHLVYLSVFPMAIILIEKSHNLLRLTNVVIDQLNSRRSPESHTAHPEAR